MSYWSSFQTIMKRPGIIIKLEWLRPILKPEGDALGCIQCRPMFFKSNQAIWAAQVGQLDACISTQLILRAEKMTTGSWICQRLHGLGERFTKLAIDEGIVFETLGSQSTQGCAKISIYPSLWIDSSPFMTKPTVLCCFCYCYSTMVDKDLSTTCQFRFGQEFFYALFAWQGPELWPSKVGTPRCFPGPWP